MMMMVMVMAALSNAVVLLLLVSSGSVLASNFTFADNTTFVVNQTRYLMYFRGTHEWLEGTTQPQPASIQFQYSKRTHESVSVHYAWQQQVISDRGTNTIVVYQGTVGTAVFAHVGTSPHVGHVTVDWLSNNVYWTDPAFGWIGLQALKQDLRRLALNGRLKVVVSSSLDTPYGVTVLPQIKRLFWTDHGATPKLESSDLLGLNRRVLLWQGMAKPTGLSADHATLRLYWVDETKGTVESCDMEGKGRRIVISVPGTSSLAGLQVFEDSIIVSERNGNELRVYNKETGRVTAPAVTGIINPGDVAVFSSVLQPRENVTCTSSSCDHICIHEGGCVCSSGYAIADDGKTCTERATSLRKSFLVNTGSQVCAVPVNILFSHVYLHPSQLNSNVQCFLTPNFTGAAGSNSIGFLAVDSVNATLYYAVGRQMRRFHIYNGSDVEVTSASGDILGMAHDWRSGTLVWTQQSPLQAVFSFSPASAAPVAVYQNLAKPTHMAVDPYRGSMYWIESPDGATSAHIWSGMVNGSGVKVKVLSTGLTKPQHLTYDHKTDKLYWLDVDHVGAVDPDGTRKHIISLSSQSSYKGLTVFRGYIVWSTTTAGTTKQMTFRDVDFTQTDSLTSFNAPSKITDISGIVFYDASVNLDSGMVSCELDNGGCSQLCIVEKDTFHCRCRFGFRLHQDGVTCVSDVVSSNLFLVTDTLNKQMYQISADNTAVAMAVPAQNDAPPELAVYNWVTRDIIWHDSQAGAIKVSSLDGRSVRVLRSLREAGQSNPSTVGALCVDHSANNLFFTEIKADNSKGWIRVISLHTQAMKTLNESQVPVRLLAIAPTKGLLVYGTDNGGIFQADMAMQGTVTQLTSVQGTLSGLVFSDNGRAVQWSMAEADELWRIELSSRVKETRLFKTGSHPGALAAWGSTLYYLTASRRAVNMLSSAGAESTVLQFAEFGRLSSLSFFGPQAPREVTACSERNGRCSTLCIPKGTSDRLCQCVDGHSLLADKRTCTDVERCSDQVRNGQLSASCDRFPREACTYTCLQGFAANPSLPYINCSSSGQWKPSTDSLCLPTCPRSVANGQIGAGCAVVAGAACAVTCDAGFSVAEAGSQKVTCGQDGKWSVPSDRMCHKSEDGETLPVWAIGVISAVAVAVVAVVVGCVLFRRMKKYGGRGKHGELQLATLNHAHPQAAGPWVTPGIVVTSDDLGGGATGGKSVEEEEYDVLEEVAEEAARYQSFSKISPNLGARWSHGRSRSPLPNGGLHNPGFQRPDSDYLEPLADYHGYASSLTTPPAPTPHGPRSAPSDDYLTPSQAQAAPSSGYGGHPGYEYLSGPQARSIYPSAPPASAVPTAPGGGGGEGAGGYARALAEPANDYLRVISAGPPRP